MRLSATTRITNKIKQTCNSTWIQLKTVTKNPILTQNNISQMFISLKKSTLISFGQGVGGGKGTAAGLSSRGHPVPVLSAALSLCPLEPRAVANAAVPSTAAPPPSGLQKKAPPLEAAAYLGGCSPGPLYLRGGGHGDGVGRGGGSL